MTFIARRLPGSHRNLTPAAMFCFVWAGFHAVSFAQSKPPLRHARLNVLASHSIVGAINSADAQAAGSIWVQSIGRRRGFQLDSRFEIGENLEVMRKAVEDFTVDLVILDTVEYLKLAPLQLLQPFVAIARGKTGPVQNNYLVVNGDSGITTIADLRGKSLVSYSRADADFGKMWLGTLLNEQHLGRTEHFFGSIGRVSKPSGACLPVFFGKIDACIVNGAGWDILTEMNPQLASRLRVIATSPAYLEGLACIHVNHKDFHDELFQSMLELDRDPEGRQLMIVFKGDRLVAVKDQDVANVRELWKKYQSFTASPEPAARPTGTQALRRQ